jgi:hypothetical protein
MLNSGVLQNDMVLYDVNSSFQQRVHQKALRYNTLTWTVIQNQDNNEILFHTIEVKK